VAGVPTADADDARRTITADRDGVIRRWGNQATEYFGYSADEGLGRKVALIIPPVLRASHWRGFNRAMESGHLKRPGAVWGVAVHNDGDIVPFLAKLVLTQSDSGSVDGVVAVLLRRGSTWLATAWRAVLASLNLTHRLWGARLPRRHRSAF
jgi:PAS domain S-box-containing protein